MKKRERKEGRKRKEKKLWLQVFGQSSCKGGGDGVLVLRRCEQSQAKLCVPSQRQSRAILKRHTRSLVSMCSLVWT